MGHEHVNILLAEDNEADVDLIRENLESSKLPNELHVVVDGEQALAYLRRQGQYLDAPRPDLMLLDLNLPKKDGRQVLAEMKADASLRRIPVVILTSSQAEADIVKCYDLQASAYVSKPVDLAGFAKIIKGIESFWFSVVNYPAAQ